MASGRRSSEWNRACGLACASPDPARPVTNDVHGSEIIVFLAAAEFLVSLRPADQGQQERSVRFQPRGRPQFTQQGVFCRFARKDFPARQGPAAFPQARTVPKKKPAVSAGSEQFPEKVQGVFSAYPMPRTVRMMP